MSLRGIFKKTVTGLLIVLLATLLLTEMGVKGFFYKKAASAFDAADFDNAVRYCRLALKFDPRYDKAHYGLGLIYDAKGDCEKAVANLNKALEINPSFAPAYSALGAIFYGENDIAKAVDYLSDAIKYDPDLPEAHYNLGAAYLKNKEYAKAIKSFETAAKLDPLNVEIYFNLGRAYMENKDPKRASENFMLASNIYLSEESLFESDAEIFKAAPRERSAEGFYKKGITFLLSRQVNRAVQSFEDAVTLYSKPEDKFTANAYRARGIIYVQQMEFPQAIKYLNKAIGINPRDGDAYYGLAEAYAGMKRYEKADECYEKAVTLLRKQGKKGKAKVVFLKRVENQERKMKKRIR